MPMNILVSRLSIFLFLCLILGSKTLAQTDKIGVNLAINEIYYHTGKTESVIPDFNIPFTSASIALHVSKKWQKFGATIEPGIIEKAGLFEKVLKDSFGLLNEFHINLVSTFDYHPFEFLSLSLGPEVTFPISVTNISDNNINIASAIFGATYSFNKKIDIGLRYKNGIRPIGIRTYVDNFGNTIGQSEYSNDYLQFFVRFNIFNDTETYVRLDDNYNEILKPEKPDKVSTRKPTTRKKTTKKKRKKKKKR